jgi:hypothetical protein
MKALNGTSMSSWNEFLKNFRFQIDFNKGIIKLIIKLFNILSFLHSA